jgi:hypothetical protein
LFKLPQLVLELLYGKFAGTLTMIGLVQSSPTARLPPSGAIGTTVIVEGSLSGPLESCAQDTEENPRKTAMDSINAFQSQFLVNSLMVEIIKLINK